MDTGVVVLLITCLCCLIAIGAGLVVSWQKKWLFWAPADPVSAENSIVSTLGVTGTPAPYVSVSPHVMPAAGGEVPAPGPGASWTDNFSAGAIDKARWTVIDADVGVNDEQQYYSPNNVKVDAEGLHLTAKREKIQNKPFTSGKVVSTSGLKMGTVSVTCRLPPNVAGMWPAVWLLPRSTVEGKGTAWPNGGEIDIMEWRGRTGDYASTLHWLSRAASGQPDPIRSEDWMKDDACHSLPNQRDCHMNKSAWSTQALKDGKYHAWAVSWDATQMRFSLDDKVYHTILWADWFGPAAACDAGADPNTWPMHDRGGRKWNSCNPFTSGQEWLVILNLAVGGVFDTLESGQQTPPSTDLGPWDFNIKSVTVTPSS